MSDSTDPKTLIPEESSQPQSSQEPTEQPSENPSISNTSEATQGPQEAQGNDFDTKAQSEQLGQNRQNKDKKDQTAQIEDSSQKEQETQSGKPETAQIPVNEPLEDKEEKPEISGHKLRKLNDMLVEARNVIQFIKKKKLEKIMTLFLKKQKITNDEVEKLLHVSDATATRYLSELEKQGKIKQEGKVGSGVSYSRI